MLIGNLLKIFISPAVTSILGSAILIALGLFVFISTVWPQKKNESKTWKDKDHHNQLSTFHHFKTVITDPHRADKDQSGTISVAEALILGTALALDAFGAGLGAAMLGYSPILTSILIATMSGLFVFSGIKVGFLLSQNKTLAKLTYLPPILLICIGVYNLL